MLASHWPAVLASSVALALAWTALGLATRPPPFVQKMHPAIERASRWFRRLLGPERLAWLERALLRVTRTLGHVEAFGAWVVVAMAAGPGFPGLPLAVLIVSFGGGALQWVTRLSHPELETTTWEFHEARRGWIYAATMSGILALMACDLDQARTLLATGAAQAIGLLLRALASNWHLKRARAEATADKARPKASHDARWAIGAGLALMLGVLVLEHQDTAVPQGGTAISPARCEVDDDAAPRVGLFLVADNQAHELRGEVNAAQLPMIDELVPVARRPVALDLLGGAAVFQASEIYRQHASAYRAKGQDALRWAHLGDFADHACVSEFKRLETLIAAFGADELAGVALGNHDRAFTGNFVWHPDWARACQPERADGAPGPEEALADLRLDKLALVEGVGAILAARPPGYRRSAKVRGWASVIEGSAALPGVARLGTLAGRPVIAAFVDTADANPWWRIGIAGVQGEVSAEQVAWLKAEVFALGGPTPWLVVLMHHPFDELSGASRRLLRHWFEEEARETVLGVVAAHTHVAQIRAPLRINGRLIPHFVIGSLLDPPQEAALLEIVGRRDDDKRAPRLHLRTLQVVHRPAMTCGPTPGAVAAEACDRHLAALAMETACDGHLRPPPLQAIESFADLKTLQRRDAEALATCLCRESAHDPTHNAAGAVAGAWREGCKGLGLEPRDANQIDAMAKAAIASGADPAAATRYQLDLVCLGWLASVQQGVEAYDWPNPVGSRGLGVEAPPGELSTSGGGR